MVLCNSIIDQIFKLREILENRQEKQIKAHHLFVDFKAVLDTPHRDDLNDTMSEFSLPVKLVRICEMTLRNGQYVVKVGNNISVPFDAKW